MKAPDVACQISLISASAMPSSSHRAFLLLCLAAATLAKELSDGLKINVTHAVDCNRKTQNGDVISMQYKGTLADGSVFDASKPENPFTFGLGQRQVIPGWDEGLLDMCIGEERTLVIPPYLAYGSRGVGPIPPNAVLTFETKLLSINGVQEDTPASDSTNEGKETAVAAPSSDGSKDQAGAEDGKCRLLGPFALLVQGALGLLALFSLVWKRWRERPRRPLKIWFFDVSKQVFGSALLHLGNLAVSELNPGGAGELTAKVANTVTDIQDSAGHYPNPCSLYLINIAVDTTIGIAILVVILRGLHYVFRLTPLARPVESIKSGHYGNPARTTWWLKQLLIYTIGLVLMKVCVLLVFTFVPYIILIGDWALRWTEGSEALQIAFVMFVFPLLMNALQYYIIDSFIKGHDETEETGNTGEDVREQGDEDEDDEEQASRRGLLNRSRGTANGGAGYAPVASGSPRQSEEVVPITPKSPSIRSGLLRRSVTDGDDGDSQRANKEEQHDAESTYDRDERGSSSDWERKKEARE